MKAIYFGDPVGDIEEERAAIQEYLESNDIIIDIVATDIPPWDEKFDVLFFDWGGMSLGNSMLEHFCRWIIEHAENHPGNIYIMTSVFTKRAMKDALQILPEQPNNIYLDLKDPKVIKVLKIFS